MKKCILLLSLITIAPVLFISCKGVEGAVGDPGNDGPAGLSVMSFQDGVFPSDAYSGTQDDSLVSGGSANNNYGTSTVNTVGYNSGNVYRPVIKFDLTSIVPGDVIVEHAYLTVTIDTAAPNTINVYAVAAAWDEMQCTWMNRLTSTPWTAAGGDKGALQDSKVCGSTTLVFSLDPALVGTWISDPLHNYGVLLQASDESTNNEVNVSSREETTASARPRLTIYYRLP